VKKLLLLSLVVIMVTAPAWLGFSTATPEEPSLSRYVPSGPLLYLEAKDFSSLLSDWNASPQKQRWIESSNFEVFSRSRLFLRLKTAGDQFRGAAGLPPDMNFLAQVAGTRSALALYDIGNLQFLYITTLPSAKSGQTLLWQTRAKFESRSVAGSTFYIRRDPEGKREVSFAIVGDYLLLATREDLIVGALQLIAGAKDRAMTNEPWWQASLQSARAAGDLRMVLNLDKIVPSSYFRTYWVQQNITELKQYSSAVSDLYVAGTEFREERVLVKKSTAAVKGGVGLPDTSRDPGTSPGPERAVQLVALVPDQVGLYAAKADPSEDSCIDLLRDKFLDPQPANPSTAKTAPQVQLGTGEAGSAFDLETRIDQPVAELTKPRFDAREIRNLLGQNKVVASLSVQSAEQTPSGVFVKIPSAAVFVGASDWDANTAESAIAHSVRPELTAGDLGVTWIARSGYKQLSGLWPLFVAIRGSYLIVADDEVLIQQLLSNINRKSQHAPAIFLAEFRHTQERANFSKLSSVLDRPYIPTSSAGAPRDPPFFSDNISSLSSTFRDLGSEEVVVRHDGENVRQTVTYHWSK